MTNDIYKAYDQRSAEWPILQSRSYLYHLEPIGVGTSEVESFTSYLVRLAQAHGIRTGKLIEQEIAPRSGQTHLIGTPSLNGFLSVFARSLNGTEILAAKWTQILEQLTLRNDLRFLTLLKWRNVLTPSGSIHKHRAWCPLCYEEWKAIGQIVYDPLIWTLKVVTECLRHRQRLHLQCPICQRFQPAISFRAPPGHCNNCGIWLGMLPQIESLRNDPLAEATSQRQRWNVQAVGELLAAAPYVSVPPKERTRLAICAYVQHLTNGNLNAFAKHLELPDATLWQMRHGRTPRLSTLLELCYRLGTTPLHFLTEDLMTNLSMDIKTYITPTTDAKPRGRPTLEEIDRLRGALEAILARDEEPPPSLEEAIARVGSFDKTLRRLFPELCSAITARYRAFNATNRIHLQRALEAALVSDQTPLPTVSDIARQLGYKPTSPFAIFPELCRTITARHHTIKETYLNDLQNILEEALASTTKPALTLDEVARRTGCGTGVLRKHFRNLCLAFAAQQRTPVDMEKTRQALESMLASEEDPPPSMSEMARRLQRDRHILTRHFPDLCQAISARYLAYQKARHQQRLQLLCEEVRRAILELHAQDVYPSAVRIMALISKPGNMQHKEVFAAWQDTLRELGLKT